MFWRRRRIRIDPSDAPEARIGADCNSIVIFLPIPGNRCDRSDAGGARRSRGIACNHRHQLFCGRPCAAATPVKTAAVNEALGRINRELTALKAGLDSSAKVTNQQVAKIADRMDRAEKAQTDAGTKLAKASETLDRIERRSSAVPAASTDITGAIGDMNVASATPSEPRQPSSLLTVDGWVLRGVYNGPAMI